MAFEIFVDGTRVFFDSFFRDLPEALNLSLFVMFLAVSCCAAVMLVILGEPKCKDGVFSP
jgi:hypothetical protein